MAVKLGVAPGCRGLTRRLSEGHVLGPRSGTPYVWMATRSRRSTPFGSRSATVATSAIALGRTRDLRVPARDAASGPMPLLRPLSRHPDGASNRPRRRHPFAVRLRAGGTTSVHLSEHALLRSEEHVTRWTENGGPRSLDPHAQQGCSSRRSGSRIVCHRTGDGRRGGGTGDLRRDRAHGLFWALQERRSQPWSDATRDSTC